PARLARSDRKSIGGRSSSSFSASESGSLVFARGRVRPPSRGLKSIHTAPIRSLDSGGEAARVSSGVSPYRRAPGASQTAASCTPSPAATSRRLRLLSSLASCFVSSSARAATTSCTRKGRYHFGSCAALSDPVPLGSSLRRLALAATSQNDAGTPTL